jgi:predicted RNA-binding protein YlxR (DUF448 family)
MLAALDRTLTDAGAKTAGSERMCIVTREVRPVGDMIRFVAGPDGNVTPDLKHKLPGRGVWVTAHKVLVADAVKRGAFKRGLKAEVAVCADLADRVEELLVQSVLDGLSMAHKAGQLVTGFVRVENAAAKADIVAVIHAAGAGADGARKIEGVLRGRGDGRNIGVISGLTSDQLDLALGRSNVIHAALLAGRASETVMARCERLELYRMKPAPKRQVGLELGIE